MNTTELKSVMQKWATQCGSVLLTNALNKRGHESAFSFVWTKPLWVLGEDGWEIEDDMGEPILICAVEDGELFIGPDVPNEEEGYSMVLLMDEAEEVDMALDLLWNGTPEVFEDPMPDNLEDTRLGELRAWFELNFTPDEEEHSCCCDSEECDDSCVCEHGSDVILESRMITLACESQPKPMVHCPVCGKAAAPNSCSHILFINENGETMPYLSEAFAKILEERGIDKGDFITDPEQLRDDDSWDSDYLFLDVLQVPDNIEMATNLYVGFHCKW